MNVVRRLWWLVAAVVLIAGVAAAFAVGRSARAVSAEASPPPPSVPTVTVAQGTIVESVSAQGRVGPPAGSDAKLAFAESGILARIDVQVGQRVSAGTVLAELDRAPLAAALAQARADAAAAAAGYGGGAIPGAAAAGARAKLVAAQERLATLDRGGEAAQSDRIGAATALRQASLKVEADARALARAQTLFAGGVLAAKDLDAARAQLDSDRSDERAARARVAASDASYRASLAQARADYEQARSDATAAQGQTGVLGAQASSAAARLAAAQLAYDNGILRAPNDGYVLAVLKHAGEAIDPTTPAVDLGPSADDRVTFEVPADRARRISAGDSVTYGDEAAHAFGRGHVIAVAPAVDPTTQQTTVVASGAPPRTFAGDAVTGTIDIGRARGLVVPQTAVVTDPQTGKNVVFVRTPSSDSGFAAREVSLGATDGHSVQVLSGLSQGLRVASQGGYELLAPSGS